MIVRLALALLALQTAPADALVWAHRAARDYLAHLREKMGAAAAELEDFEVAYARTDWSRFARLPAFDAANRRNAYNTYIRMQGGDR